MPLLLFAAHLAQPLVVQKISLVLRSRFAVPGCEFELLRPTGGAVRWATVVSWGG